MASKSSASETESACESEAESASDASKRPRRTSRLSLPTTKKRESLQAGIRPKVTTVSPETTATASIISTESPAMPSCSSALLSASRESLVADYSSAEPASSATEDSENEAGTPTRRSRRGVKKSRY